MNILKFVLESRGPVNLTKRTFQILSRFGLRPERMGARFEAFMDLLDQHGCRPTFPITALPMSRNPRFAHRLVDRGAELAVHAYTHTDLTTLGYEQQSEHMGKAIQLFRRHGVPFSGFRAPYLHSNEETMRVVEDYRFRYSSNDVVMWDVLDTNDLSGEQRAAFARASEFYKPRLAEDVFVLPYRRRGFVEIPVSLPDDEILLDRMYVKDVTALGELWQRILEQTYARGELFTVQLHPERIAFFTEPLGALLADCRSRKPGVWVATLDEIAEWWIDKTQNSAEFIREGTGYVAVVKACKGSTVHLREDGRERVLEPGDIRVVGDLRPCVGASAGSARESIQLLQSFGYVIEIGEETENFAVHVGELRGPEPAAMRPVLQRLDNFPGPLLRFGTWPHGNRSALSVTGDIDALTLWDFFHRFRGA